MKGLIERLQTWQKATRQWIAYDADVARAAVTRTVQRILWTAPVLAVGNFLAALGFRLREAPLDSTEVLWREWIIRANFTVSVINVVVWVLAWVIRKRETSIKLQRVFMYSVIAYVLATGLTITGIDQLVVASITPHVLCVVIVGTFYYLPPNISLVVFSSVHVAFWLVFSLFDAFFVGSLASSLINGLIASTLGFALSLITWQQFRRTTLQERTIIQQQEALKQMAYHDSLTGLPNRRLLDDLVRREVEQVRRHNIQSSLIFCDIDDFKAVNDTFGHVAGDDLLRQFATLLQEHMRIGDTLVRLGGEEFVILAPHTSAERAKHLAEWLRSIVAEHEFSVEANDSIKITASFGVADLQGTEGERDYYHNADQALYQAKQAGKNCVVVANPKRAVI